MSPLEVVLAGACALACLALLAGALACRRALVVLPRLAEVEPARPQAWPRVSVVVAARDEADTLPAAMEAHLRTDYPDVELVVVDDRSTDGTGALADALAARDARVRAVHVTERPDDWMGKVWALREGERHATGEYLLLTDADVHIAPDGLRRAITLCERRGADHLAVMPDVWSRGVLLDLALAAFARSFVLGQRIWDVERPGSSAYVGVGAFNLVRREAFERAGGFGWFRLDVADDLALGLMMKRSGARSLPAWGHGVVGLEWYPSLGAMVRGLEKNTFAVFDFRVGWALVALVAVLGFDSLPIVALFLDEPAWLRPLAAGSIGVGLAIGVLLARRAARPAVSVLAMPLATLLFTYIVVRSVALGLLRGGIRWRKTFYPASMLRGRMRAVWPFPRA